jgi:hypothetical protein
LQSSATDPLAKSVAILRELRGHLEETLTSVDWEAKSHADLDALGFAFLVMTKTAAVELLADNDVAFAIAAGGPARAAWEAAVNAAWLVAPLDVASRDRRWLGLLLSERAYWESLKEEFETMNRGSSAIAASEGEIQRLTQIISAAEPQLKKFRIKRPRRVPDFRGRLTALKKERQYFMWSQASQYVHPGNRALEQFRSLKEHGSNTPTATFEIRTTRREWSLVIGLSGEAIMLCGEALARLTPPGALTAEALAVWKRLIAEVQVLA